MVILPRKRAHGAVMILMRHGGSRPDLSNQWAADIHHPKTHAGCKGEGRGVRVRVRENEPPSVGSGATLQESRRIKLQRREGRTRDRQSRDTLIKTT